MTWEKGAIMRCDTCRELVDSGDNRVMTIARARARGWGVFDGRTIGGSAMVSHICPQCRGTNRSRLPAPPPRLEEDEQLF
jgi:predicted RNA-binding Zn-ribbon protein involved in translation (DUF1610 family)